MKKNTDYNEITIDDFKGIIISIIDNNKIDIPKNKKGCLKIKEKNFIMEKY